MTGQCPAEPVHSGYTADQLETVVQHSLRYLFSVLYIVIVFDYNYYLFSIVSCLIANNILLKILILYYNMSYHVVTAN